MAPSMVWTLCLNLLGLGSREMVRHLPEATLKKQLGRLASRRLLTSCNITLPLLTIEGICSSMP